MVYPFGHVPGLTQVELQLGACAQMEQHEPGNFTETKPAAQVTTGQYTRLQSGTQFGQHDPGTGTGRLPAGQGFIKSQLAALVTVQLGAGRHWHVGHPVLSGT